MSQHYALSSYALTRALLRNVHLARVYSDDRIIREIRSCKHVITIMTIITIYDNYDMLPIITIYDNYISDNTNL